jgi:radical SAM protein with 4Fe4S-binding SPASM domain
MSICVLSQQEMFDLRSGSFREGWESFLGDVRSKKVTRATKCKECQIRELCSTCAATAELEHGDAETPVEYFCEVAHLRAHAVGYTPPAHGDCAFCEGGERHAHLLEEVAAIERGARAGGRPRSLRVVSDRETSAAGSCGSGCGSCGCA